METAYSILQNHLSLPYCLSLLIVFIATLIIWKAVEKRKQGDKRTCGNEEKKWTQAVLISLFVTYIFFILLITLIARTPADTRRAELIPFWSWYEVIVNHSTSLAVEILLNILLFVPVGILARLQNFRLRPILLFSFLLSLSIELTQYFTCRGLCEIFDDVIGNTVGGVIGWIACGYVMRICVEKRHNPSAKKQ
ncbi:MAG: VanZ family protein [Clostridiaceae bacterium]|nr:VanZ family protein [Clostridiaceae bacterium]